MSESINKLDRAGLRRKAQRIENYKSLITRPKLKKLHVEEAAKLQSDVPKCMSRENEDDKITVDNLNLSSPVKSLPTCSSDLYNCYSQDFQQNLSTNLEEMQKAQYQSELEITSVMTRSASRKYALVGAIHNRVNFEKELKLRKQWPKDISYPIPVPTDDHSLLRQTVNIAFNEVLAFCKNAHVPDNRKPSSPVNEVEIWEAGCETAGTIDLTSYPILQSGNEESPVMLQVDDNSLTHQLVNIIALDEDEKIGSLVVDEDAEECDTITIHTEETYLVEDKYFKNTSLSYSANNQSVNNIIDDPMIGVHNDHTYAQKFTDNVTVVKHDTTEADSFNYEQNKFKLKNALDDLLLNTAILKCLVCNETPYEIMCHLQAIKPYL